MAAAALSNIPDDCYVDTGVEWYHEEDKNSDCLLITVGDSWTWGQGLGGTNWSNRYDNKEYRLNHIYGKLLADYLNSDHINVGLPGHDNIYILYHFDHVISTLTRKYKKIYVVFTLTEVGRELNGGWLKHKDNWNSIRGCDWPTYNEISNFTYNDNSLKFALTEMQENNIFMRHHLEIFLKFRNQTSPRKILEDIDEYVVNQIVNVLNKHNVTWVLGKNFANFSKIYTPNQLKKRWVDIIAERGNIAPYVDNILIVTPLAFTPFEEYVKYANIKNVKSLLLPLATDAVTASDWLYNSPYNCSATFQHPLDDAQRWWTEYLIEQLII